MKKIKNFILLLCFICFPILFTSVSYAKEIEKDIEIKIPDNYVQCSFIATFEKEVVENTILVDPNGNKYSFTENIGGEGLKCTLKNVKPGVYHVIASVDTAHPDTESTLEEENSESVEEQDIESDADLSPDDVIGKITVTVKAEDESAAVVSSNIKIAKEIDGLQIYWKDDSIVVEWSDDSVGNVNINVMNSKTLQILASEKVTNKYFEHEIDQSIEEIIISIVPSESASVKGAGNEYVKKVNNHPDGSVYIEPYEYTNLDAIPAKVTLGSSYRLLYTVNDEKVGETDFLDAGDYDIEVPTVLGQNDMKVYIVDHDGNMRSTGITFIKDVTPPILKIKEDITGIQTYNDKISFEGTVEDFDTLMFRNENVFVDWDGTFSIEASLKDGENELVLTATDLAGNEAVYTAVVTKLVKEEKPIPWNIVIPAGIILLLLVIFLIVKKLGLPSITVKRTTRKVPQKKNFGVFSRTDMICYIVCILAFIVLIQYVFKFAIVSSSSMEPSINTGEVILMDRLAYTVKEPRRGDIVLFKSDEYKNEMLKRIIGMPGDEITFVDGYIFVNGIICNEQAYLSEDIETNCQESFTVPDGHYFLLGDNRSNSNDSRFWSEPYIDQNKIIGKLLIHVNLK